MFLCHTLKAFGGLKGLVSRFEGLGYLQCVVSLKVSRAAGFAFSYGGPGGLRIERNCCRIIKGPLPHRTYGSGVSGFGNRVTWGHEPVTT